ncbi:hypothetical protein ACFL60_07065 [Candidatus Omnitrophota bacterium]
MFSLTKEYWRLSLNIMLLLLLVSHSGMLNAQVHAVAENLLIYDTVSPFSPEIDIQERTGWKNVPAGDISAYSPDGDVVIEHEYLTAVFSRESGKVILYSRLGESLQRLHRGYLIGGETGTRRLELIPLQLKGKKAGMTSCSVQSKTADQAAVTVTYSGKEEGQRITAEFLFSREQIIEIKPSATLKGISLSASIEFALVPNFVCDDLIFDPGQYSSGAILELPSENMVCGLLQGKSGMLVITLPEGAQDITLTVDKHDENAPLFGAVDIGNDGKSVFVALLDAPRIWHKVELKPSYLEKDIAVNWKRPFHAKWITQLIEDGIKTTFPFRRPVTPYFRGEAFFRSGIGTYTYPLWFRSEHLGERPYYRLGKKVPPKGDSIIYFMEGRDDIPLPVSSPADIVKRTLGDRVYEKILDFEGRQNRSLRRAGVFCNSATCHVTARLKPIFQAGKESEKKELVIEGIKDLIDFLEKENGRGLEYQKFAHDMIRYLASMKKDKPGSKVFLDEMETIIKEIIAAYEIEKENLKDLDYAAVLAKETEALLHNKSTDNYKAFLTVQKKWTGMGGAIDDLNRKHHTLTRKLFQEAGYRCVGNHETVEIARKIRTRAIQCLRRPNRYEIWMGY